MNRSLTLTLVGLLAAGPAAARDGRIQTVIYQPKRVISVAAAPGFATQITLALGEQVIDSACGFAQGWSVTAKGNQLYLAPRSVGEGEEAIKPTARDWTTNLLVTTDRRQYAFRLALSGAPAYRIEFVYPEEQRREMAKAAVKSRLTDASTVTARNWNYSMQVAPGSDAITPAAAWDDGRFTYLRFSGNRPMPAVFAVNTIRRTEILVNTHIDPDRPDWLVIQAVEPELALRLGAMAVGVFNDAYDAAGLPSVEGTTVPGVRRVLRAASDDE